VNFFTGRGGDGHDSPILDDCFEKALFFIDFIDEKRPYQPSQASYYGKYLKMIFFSYFHLWLYISIWEITRIPSARLHQYTLPHWIFPDFAETAAATPPALINGEIHLPYCRCSRMVLPLQFRIFHSSMPYVANASPSLPDDS